MKNIRYILAQCAHGQTKKGVDKGPMELYQHLKSNKIPFSTEKELFYDNTGYQQLYEHVTKSLLHNELPVTLGGDHSISLGTIPAVLDNFKNNMSIVWIDAHADINTLETSTTKNLHGMPVASIFHFMEPIVKSQYRPTYDQLFYLGLRDIDEPERKLLDKYDITYYSQNNIREYGLSKILKFINIQTKQNIHISFDIDAMDPSIMPATGTPVENGMTMEEIEQTITNFKKIKQ